MYFEGITNTNILGWIISWILSWFLDCQYHFTVTVLKTLFTDYILWFLAYQQISSVTKILFIGLITRILCVRFEGVIVVNVKYMILWDVMPCILYLFTNVSDDPRVTCFCPEDVGLRLLWNIGKHLQKYMHHIPKDRSLVHYDFDSASFIKLINVIGHIKKLTLQLSLQVG